jgi:ubiquinone/menaquinone biosynthesis C-methylase UbiE
MISANKFWNKHAEGYSKKPVPNEDVYQKKLAMTQQFFYDEMSVLEFGCGTGSTALVHAPYVKHYLAVDVSDKMIEIAENKLTNTEIENLEFKVSAIEDFNASQASFDAVLGLSILHLLDDPQVTVKQAFDLLKPGGIFVSSSPDLSGWMRIFQPIWPIGVWLGVIPKIQFFSHDNLVSYMQEAGFIIDKHWIPEQSKRTSFIIARKPEE